MHNRQKQFEKVSLHWLNDCLHSNERLTLRFYLYFLHRKSWQSYWQHLFVRFHFLDSQCFSLRILLFHLNIHLFIQQLKKHKPIQQQISFKIKLSPFGVKFYKYFLFTAKNLPRLDLFAAINKTIRRSAENRNQKSRNFTIKYRNLETFNYPENLFIWKLSLPENSG